MGKKNENREWGRGEEKKDKGEGKEREEHQISHNLQPRQLDSSPDLLSFESTS